MRPGPGSAVLIAFIAIAGTGCQFGYVWKQGWGQLRIRAAQTPLDDPALLAALSDDERAKLAWVPRILAFARQELGLDPGDAYTTFYDAQDEPISTVVTAAHPLSLEPYRWRFPFVGRVAYKGFFSPDDATREARRLEERGYEAKLSAVSAFSTLGWFRDPVLSTMLQLDIVELIDLLLHESTHRTIYFPGATPFNESLASHVAYEGTLRMLESHPELAPRKGSYVEANLRAREREKLVRRLRSDLDALYSSTLPERRKLVRRAEIFDSARAAFAELVPGAVERSFPATNAELVSLTTYHAHRPALERLQERLGGDPRSLLEFLADLPANSDPLAAMEQRLSQMDFSADNRRDAPPPALVINGTRRVID